MNLKDLSDPHGRAGLLRVGDFAKLDFVLSPEDYAPQEATARREYDERQAKRRRDERENDDGSPVVRNPYRDPRFGARPRPYIPPPSGERMWVRVMRARRVHYLQLDGRVRYSGTLASDPVVIEGLQWGTRIDFEPSNVIDFERRTPLTYLRARRDWRRNHG